MANVMFKCIFVGDLSVGKTSIILRYTKNEFSGGYIPTIGADFTTTNCHIDEGRESIDLKEGPLLESLDLSHTDFEIINNKFSDDSKIYIWDLAGQPLFKKIRTYYISHAIMAVIVFDLNNIMTQNITNWIKDVKKSSPNCGFIIVGNKMDLVDFNNKELKKKIKSIESKNNVKINVVSAKSGEGVNELFALMKIRIMQKLSSGDFK